MEAEFPRESFNRRRYHAVSDYIYAVSLALDYIFDYILDYIFYVVLARGRHIKNVIRDSQSYRMVSSSAGSCLNMIPSWYTTDNANYRMSS